MSYCLIFLALLPIATFHVCKSTAKSHVWTYTGLAFGLVIAPVSQGLIEYTAIPVVGSYIGMIGGIFNLIHGSTGYLILGSLGIFEAGVVLTVSQLLLMHMINAVIWTSYYGFVGHKVDLKFPPKREEIYNMVSRQKLRHSEDA